MKGPPPGPVRRWADMTPEERARLGATARPPPKTPIEPYRFGRKEGVEPEVEKPVEVACLRRVRETAKATLYVLADTGAQKWFPRSVIEDADELDDGAVILEVSRWFANKEGLTDDP